MSPTPSSPYRRPSTRIACPNCGRYFSRRILRRHMVYGCAGYSRWSELRRLLQIEANLHGQSTTVDRVFFLMEFVHHTPLSLIHFVIDEHEETASINSAITEAEASGVAGSPMDTSPPSNSPTGTPLAPQVADATTGMAALGL